MLSVQEATENLYLVFKKYPFRQGMDFCDCSICTITREDVRALGAVPLSFLEGKNFEKYIFDAMNTWGDEDDFKHFLPRILELAVLESRGEYSSSGISLEMWIIGSRLANAGFSSWPEDEAFAVFHFIYGVFDEALSVDPLSFTDRDSLYRWLRHCFEWYEFLVPFSKDPFYSLGLIPDTDTGTIVIAHFASDLYSKKPEKELVQWFVDQIPRIEKLFFRLEKGEDLQEVLSDGIQAIEWMK